MSNAAGANPGSQVSPDAAGMEQAAAGPQGRGPQAAVSEGKDGYTDAALPGVQVHLQEGDSDAGWWNWTDSTTGRLKLNIFLYFMK